MATGKPSAVQGDENMKLIFVSGAGYTGSSAIVDYLSDFKGVGGVLPKIYETRFFSGKGGLSEFLKATSPNLYNFDFDGYLAFLKGLRGSKMAVNRNSAVVKRYGASYERKVEFLVTAFKKNFHQYPDRLNEFTQNFIYQLHSYLVGDDSEDYDSRLDFCIINNDPPASDFPLKKLAKILDMTSIVFVDRCPKGAFVDFSISKTSDVRDLDLAKKFVSKYNRGLKGILDEGRVSEKIIYVKFEEFVRSESCRASLSEVLGLDYSNYSEKSFFAPHSQNNIGKFSDFSDSSVMGYIDENAMTVPEGGYERLIAN